MEGSYTCPRDRCVCEVEAGGEVEAEGGVEAGGEVEAGEEGEVCEGWERGM